MWNEICVVLQRSFYKPDTVVNPGRFVWLNELGRFEYRGEISLGIFKVGNWKLFGFLFMVSSFKGMPLYLAQVKIDISAKALVPFSEKPRMCLVSTCTIYTEKTQKDRYTNVCKIFTEMIRTYRTPVHRNDRHIYMSAACVRVCVRGDIGNMYTKKTQTGIKRRMYT